jgi:hypothetical protein
MTTCTQSEFAALLEKDKSYVTRLKQAGRLVMTEDGRVEVEKSKALISGTADPSRSPSTGTAPRQPQQPAADNAVGNSYQQARAVNEKFKALTAKLEYEKASGKLVDADEARLFAADLAASFRGAVEQLRDRLAPVLAPLSDVESIRAVLTEEDDQMLADLADKIAKWGKSA